MISGYPSSGKTTRANQIRDFFMSKIQELSSKDPKVAKLKVHVISDQSLGISKEVYRGIHATRGWVGADGDRGKTREGCASHLLRCHQTGAHPGRRRDRRWDELHQGL